jgi:ABC-type glycerol-3-phosphate transport system substrate-binding protein
MMVKMLRKTIVAVALAAAALLAGCGTSTTSPDGGSWQQTNTGVSSSGYPAGEPKDKNSPALASSTEEQYSKSQMKEPGVK